MVSHALPVPRIAASIRLIFAMYRLYANLEAGFGEAILKILREQYSDQKDDIDLTATQVGHMMVNSAKKELQNDYDAALDAVQDFLLKITKAGTNFRADTKKGRPGAPTWRQALRNILNNVRTTAMSSSMKKWRSTMTPEDEYAALLWKKQNQGNESGGKGRAKPWRPEDDKKMQQLEKELKAAGKDPSSIKPDRKKYFTQRNKSLDEAFGKRGEDGGDPSGGEGNIPDSGGGGGGGGGLGKPLDDKAALKQFYDVLDEHVPELKRHLSEDTRALFELVFDYDIGGFGSDIKDNMGQASELKSYLTEGVIEGKKVTEPTDAMKKIYEDNAKRWSGFVGDLRKQLLDEIWDYISDYLTKAERDVLRDQFFRDTTPDEVRRIEKKKEQSKSSYQRGIDDRKVARLKWELSKGSNPKAQKDLDALTKKFGQEDLEKIEAKQVTNPTSDEDKYANWKWMVQDMTSKVEDAEKPGSGVSNNKKSKLRSDLFQAKKSLKEISDKLSLELGKKVVDKIEPSENPEGSAKGKKDESTQVSTDIAIAMRILGLRK